MDYRERFLKLLAGEPIDRLPFVENAKYGHPLQLSDWKRYVKEPGEVRALFAFDNNQVPAGAVKLTAGNITPPGLFESVPLEYNAVPRFEECVIPSNDGYVRRIDGRTGSVKKRLIVPVGEGLSVKATERYCVTGEQDWQKARERWKISTAGRFPEKRPGAPADLDENAWNLDIDWQTWCGRSREAKHPICLEVPDPASQIIGLTGLENDTGLIMSMQDRPALVGDMKEHFTALIRLCTARALSEARVDMAMIRMNHMLGQNFIRRHFLDSYADLISLVKSFGVRFICLSGVGAAGIAKDVAIVEMLLECGVNGVSFDKRIGDEDPLEKLLAVFGDKLFYIGAVNGEILVDSPGAISREVDVKISRARRGRIVPCQLHGHVLPGVPFANYRHYVHCLRTAIERSC